MKLYEKIINGQKYCLPASKIVIVKNGMQTINPTEEMLLENGWNIYNPENNDLTLEEHIMNLKTRLKEEITLYDNSEHVNLFYINDIPMWLDGQQRTKLMLRFNAETNSNITDTTLWHNGYEFHLPLVQAIQLLYRVETYASQCYDNTQRHLINVDKLETLEEVENYDFTTGYPEKLKLYF